MALSDWGWVFLTFVVFWLIVWVVLSGAGEVLRYKYQRERRDRNCKR